MTRKSKTPGRAVCRCVHRLARSLTRWAWRPEIDALAKIDEAQKNPPKGRLRMYCAGWRDKNMTEWTYYLHSIHATPEAAWAAIESLRGKHKWGEGRSTDCGQCVDVFFPPNAERIHGGAGQPKQPETPTPLDGASC